MRKGKTFERLIARKLRAVYDPPDYLARIAKATASDRKQIMSTSLVRRGEQGRNAHEPDLVVSNSDWWFELHDGGSTAPERKYKQARRDLDKHLKNGGHFERIAVICHPKNARKTTTTLSMPDLLSALGVKTAPNAVPNALVTVDFETFTELLKNEQSKQQRSARAPRRGLASV